VHGLGEFPLGVYVEGWVHVEGWWCGGWLGVCGVFVDWGSWGGLRAVGRLAICQRRSESGRYHGLGESAGAVVWL
jgi:hypothetical protein